MAITLNASTSSGLVQTADTSGVIELQNNGTTKLTVNSSGVNIGQYSAGTSLITSGTAQASTSGTSITFSGIPNWVRKITFMYSGLSSNGSSDFLVQLGTSGGITTSGYLGASCITGSGAAAANYTTGFGINQNGQGTTFVGHGIMTIALVDSAANRWVASGTMGESDAARGCYTGGSVALSGVVTQLRFTTVNGTDTFDAGTINILYE